MGAALSPYLDQPGPIALAHRGGGREMPENSRAAVEHTVALGYHYLETDLHTTSDGIVVLLHDPTVDRVTDGSGALADMTWAQAAQLRDRSGGRLLRLDEVLADFPHLRLNLDVKEDAVVGPALRVVAEAGAAQRVCFASFSDRRLRVIRRLTDGRVATSLGRVESARLVLAARTRGGAVSSEPGPHGAVCVQVPRSHRGILVTTPGFVARSHAMGLAVHVWTIDDAPTMHSLLDLGVDGIVTDRPTVLRQVLRARGGWTGSPAGAAHPAGR